MTENGTVAMREFTEENGRVWKTIYYRKRSPINSGTMIDFRTINGPIEEEDLHPFSIRLYFYDGLGRKLREEIYNSEMVLQSIADIVSGEDGRRRYVPRMDLD